MTRDELQKKVCAVLEANTKTVGDFVYTVPSIETYPYQFLWDSCFHAIAFSYLNPSRGENELLAILREQFENGLIPHMVYWERGELIDIDWGMGDKRSTITQPPMIAYAAWRLYEKNNNTAFLEKIYPNLFHFYKYLITERDPHEKRLIGLINPDESGEDNSPRFDGLLGLPPVHTFKENLEKRIALVEENKKCNFDAPFCMKNFFWVKDVPFNSIMVKNLEVLSTIATKLGRGYDAEYFSRVRDEMIESMRNLMFEDGLFWSTYGENYNKIKVKTWAIFAPLFAGFLSKEEAATLVRKHLMNETEFLSKFPVPTVSMDEPSYSEKDMWRGPTWIAINWIIYQGLKNYGFSEEMDLIQKSTLELLRESGFREYYNSKTGEGLGAKNFTWGCLALDMM